ncbi:HAD family phosphatase [Streptomyces sp. SL13]|uniref:HAD family phosphatase n=1 Tax=Streptantibioticus silvisoli TaxID=2705255 RepID=A0AA90KJL3_9ACTN|nr:HAD family phosphatase [Streptantibioticus silvisoli]MDI5967433.1 HAD family phosphatase [Streptantibioticus silvisoli]MDI5973634.1 HAD family phosphatase [Streptantibioticus silvisoli]
MRISAVLFDMDGVLIDTDEAIAALWHGLGAEFGVSIDAADIAAHVLGCSPEHTVGTVFAALGPDDRERVMDRVRAAEPTLGFAPVPQAARLVERLAAAGVPLALVTSASTGRAERVLKELGIDGAFSTSVTWGEAQRGKPAPDCYLLAARRLNVPAAECLVFEDTSSGVRAAVAAGAPCVGVSRYDPAPLRTGGARHVVRTFDAVGVRQAADGLVLTIGDEELPVTPAA